MPLTERQAKAEKWSGKDRLVSAGDCLFLLVRKASKSWLLRRRFKGRMHVKTLGKYPAMPVREARALALQLAMDRSPSEVTVEQLAGRYYTEVVEVEHKRPDLFHGYLSRSIIPDLGPRRAIDVTPAEVAAVIGRYKVRGARTADQLRSALRSMFGFAIEVGIRQDNPVASLTRRVAGYKPEARERVLSDEEIRLIWSEASPNARLLRFLLLTGLRIAEAQKGHRQGDRWIVPEEISKNGKEHWVHLTPSAVEQLPLPGSTPTNIQAWLRRWCNRHGIEPRFTPHDCRRTAATRMADSEVPPFIVERVLNHTMQGMMAVYNKAEYAAERKDAAETLERVILGVVSGEGQQCVDV